MKLIKVSVIVSCLLIIVSCTNKTTTEIPTLTPELPTTTPIPPTATPCPTPTKNSMLLNKNSHIFGDVKFEYFVENNRQNWIAQIFYSPESNLVLVNTLFGLNFYDATTWQELLSIDSYLEIISFNGQDGYMHKPIKSLSHEDGITEWEFKNFLHFTWDGNTFHTDDPVSFLNADGEEMDIVDFCHSFEGDYFFVESEYARNAKGMRVIPSAKYFYLYKETIEKPYAVLNLSNKHNISAMQFSPDGNYLAFRQNGSIIYIADTYVETSLTPRILFDSKDTYISDYKFSPDSSKMLLELTYAKAILLDISSGEKLELSLSPEDYEDENDRGWGITELTFLDNNTVIIGTNTGNMIVWDLLVDSATTYHVTNGEILNLTPFNNASVLFSFEDSLSMYDIANHQLTEIF